MKESMWGYLIIALGVFIVVILFLVQNLTSTNEQDYYLSREILRASMYDAVDYGTYMKSGKLVMSREKFVSVFTRRFAESVNPDRTYQLDFYDIYEYPPKATIRIKTTTGETTIKDNSIDLEINTFITGILETTESTGEYNIIYSTSTGDYDGDGNFSEADITSIEQFIRTNGGACGKYASVINVTGDKDCDNKDLIILKKALYSEVPLDVNGDGEFSELDVKIIRKCVNNSNCKTALTPKQFVIADVTNDGKVDLSDLDQMEKVLDTATPAN
jgi:hypothetical protein